MLFLVVCPRTTGGAFHTEESSHRVDACGDHGNLYRSPRTDFSAVAEFRNDSNAAGRVAGWESLSFVGLALPV
jgi:hypothetical protein